MTLHFSPDFSDDDRSAQTLRPLSGWMLEQAIALDEVCPGFLRLSCRTSPIWRQSFGAILAAGLLTHPALFLQRLHGRPVADDRTWADVLRQVAEVLPVLSPRELLGAGLGMVPDGYIGALKKAGAKPLSAAAYVRLLDLFTASAPMQRRRRRVLEQMSSFDEPQFEALERLDEVLYGFRAFKLDVGRWNYQPMARELLVQIMRTEKQTVITGEDGGEKVARLEDYLVARLIDFDEIDYDAHAELLYDLAGQVVAHLRSYLKDDEEVRNVLVGRSKEMAKAMLVQMQQHMWRTQTTYKITLNAPFDELKPQAFDGSGKDAIRDFRKPPEQLNQIKRFIFTGFKRGCYPHNHPAASTRLSVCGVRLVGRPAPVLVERPMRA